MTQRQAPRPGAQRAYGANHASRSAGKRKHRQEAYRSPALTAIGTARIQFLVGTIDGVRSCFGTEQVSMCWQMDWTAAGVSSVGVAGAELFGA
jgi:hypothetical protein